jgi:hypothetical protein
MLASLGKSCPSPYLNHSRGPGSVPGPSTNGQRP